MSFMAGELWVVGGRCGEVCGDDVWLGRRECGKDGGVWYVAGGLLVVAVVSMSGWQLFADL